MQLVKGQSDFDSFFFLLGGIKKAGEANRLFARLWARGSVENKTKKKNRKENRPKRRSMRLICARVSLSSRAHPCASLHMQISRRRRSMGCREGAGLIKQSLQGNKCFGLFFFPPPLLSLDVAKVIKPHRHADKRSPAALLGDACQCWVANKASDAILQTSVATSH